MLTDDTELHTTWNETILRDIWESQSKKKIMKERIEKNWGPGMLPTDEEISHAKWLGDGSLFLSSSGSAQALRLSQAQTQAQ